MTTATLEPTEAANAMSFDEIQAFLYAEARALDDREWDTWLTFYHKDCRSGCRPGMTRTS